MSREVPLSRRSAPDSHSYSEGIEARRLLVTGVVQGVGFRPFVHRLAGRHELSGWVRNESGRVFIEVEGAATALDAFTEALRSEAPVLARLDEVTVERVTARGAEGFRVLESRVSPGRLPVSPDVSVCEACRSELFTPTDRRYRYPFITCTDCGPRYTVIESMPYDRERTSMRAFPQCPACEREYGDPAERRFHSETNSCPECGPRVWVAGPDGVPIASGDEALTVAARHLEVDAVLAIRGLGGYHLACDATSDAAVSRLRSRKTREGKPLAVMTFDLAGARSLGHVGEVEEKALLDPAHPIVLLRRRADSALAPSVSPGLDTVGVMLAYTPLHLLLLERVGRPLVMTSGNVSDLPICTSNREAERKLSGVASAFLMHDREIVSRYDDSVVRVIRGAPVFLRRARGYAPLPVPLPVPTPEPLLAVGPHLKNTFTLAAGTSAFVSQHVGDLENVETLDHFRDSLLRFKGLFRIEPVVVARDRHPGYLSSRIAEELGLARVVDVQHHHAHVAAVAAEHGITQPVVGVAYDGTGYGDDGHTWGAEILVADLANYRRVAQLRYAPMPGGDLAARRPWRAAAGYRSLDRHHADAFAGALSEVPESELSVVEAQIERRVNAPLASSMGRLFDAAAAILGIRGVATYEGQAAMELEALASVSVVEGSVLRGDPSDLVTRRDAAADRFPVLEFPFSEASGEVWVMDPVPLLVELGGRATSGERPGDLAAAFHLAVGRTTIELTHRACRRSGIDRVVLGGGVFQNALLLAIVEAGLVDRGLQVFAPERLGPNDGSISYGQAAVAAACLAAERGR